MRNVGPGHVAGHQDRIRIVGADGGIEHCSPTAGAYNFEITRANAKRRSCEGKEQNQMMPHLCHLILSFTFDIFASPLSGKVQKLSTVKWRLRSNDAEKKRSERCRAARSGWSRHWICSRFRKSRIQFAGSAAQPAG